MSDPVDPVALTQQLIRAPSVTPDTGSALDVIAAQLTALGFDCHTLTFSEEGWADVPNLWARLGHASPCFCFAGHTDVVPVGESSQWEHPPFDATVEDGMLYGRGAVDMKGALAAMVAATARFVREHDGHPPGSIAFLLTGDEEGPAVNGTKKVLQWLSERGEQIDACLVGEPTSPHTLGEAFKIGRRGSLHGVLTAEGKQGHVAYPHLADNPIPKLVKLIDALLAEPLDTGNAFFQPSNLEVLELIVDNKADNVIPAEATARFNVRFNSEHTPESLKAELRRRLDTASVDYRIDWRLSGDSFLTAEGPLSQAVVAATEARLGKRPEASTAGGTSDARFIKDACPVVEMGLVGATMHRIDERVAVEDIEALTDIYVGILQRMLGTR
jgi:succinyl-diaminopimelate desuccinylase